MTINNFSEFLSENKNSVSFLKKNANNFGQYVNLNILPNGNLEISLTEEGKTEIEEYDNITIFNTTVISAVHNRLHELVGNTFGIRLVYSLNHV